MKIVAIGIRKKGEKGFRLATIANLKWGDQKTEVPIEYSHENKNHVISFNYSNIINNTPTR